jgi:regulatory protein
MNKVYLQKAAGFCAYQERTQAEVRERLNEWSIYGDEAEEMIAWLISNNYINEERFALAFAGGKFRIKKWGKTRILYELRQRGLSTYCINKAMESIDLNDYLENLNSLIEKKSFEFNFDNTRLKQQKIVRYLIGKGYESSLVWKHVANYFQEQH